MKNSSKQRRITQDCVIASPLGTELFQGWSSCHPDGGNNNNLVAQQKQCSASSHDCTCLERAVQSHPCLATEKNSSLVRIHGVLVFKLSRKLAKTNSSTSRQYQETLTSLNKLYQSSNIADLLDLEGKFVAFMTVKCIYVSECDEQQRDEKTVVHCVNILNSLVTSWFDWNLVKTKDFHDILMTLVRVSTESESLETLHSIKDRSTGMQRKEVSLVLAAMSDRSRDSEVLSARELEGLDDLTLVMKIETRFLMKEPVLMEQEVLSRIVRITCSEKELVSTRAMNCLVLAGQRHPDRKDIIEALLEVLVNGDKNARDLSISSVYKCATTGNVKLVSLDCVRNNTKKLITAILQSIRANSQGNGRNTSVHCSRLLEFIFQGYHAATGYLELSDIVGICTALFDNPHTSVSARMCNTLLEHLSSTVPSFEDTHVDAVSTLARFSLDKGCNNPEVSMKVARYYLQLTRVQNDTLTNLARVPYLLDSVVSMAQKSRGHQALNDVCLELITQFAKSPLNWKRLACTSGVIPLLIQHVQSSETDHPYLALSPLPGREVFKTCIQNLAAAI